MLQAPSGSFRRKRGVIHSQPPSLECNGTPFTFPFPGRQTPITPAKPLARHRANSPTSYPCPPSVMSKNNAATISSPDTTVKSKFHCSIFLKLRPRIPVRRRSRSHLTDTASLQADSASRRTASKRPFERPAAAASVIHEMASILPLRYVLTPPTVICCCPLPIV